MRQVPKNSYLLVGDGKLASHWALFLKLNNLPFTQWSRSQTESQADTSPLDLHIENAQNIFVAISDSALDSFYDQHLKDFKGQAFHFSGSYYRSGFVGIHPLMTFSESLYPESVYKNLSFTVDHSGSIDFLDLLENSCSVISPSDKELYHALCVVAANFPQMLWKFSLTEFAKLGIHSEAVSPLIKQAMENFLAAPKSALTGPHSRGDATTVKANSRALRNHPEKQIYDAFTRVYATQPQEVPRVRP